MTVEVVPEQQVTPERILQLGLAFWGSKTLLSAVELGLFGLLADGPLDAEQIRGRLGLHVRGVRDFLDALVALGMLERDGARYANTAATGIFLDPAKPSYIGGMLEMANARLYPFWGRLTDALRTGEPQNEAREGGDFFAEIYAQPDGLGRFMHAMTGLSMGDGHAIAEHFPWAGYETVLDAGTAEGGVLVEILRANPHLSGIGLDLPAAQPVFDAYVAAQGVADRARFVGADFFAGPLPAADVIVLGHVLHDWGLEHKQQLLGRAFDALPEGGAVIVFESMIDDERSENAFGLLMSLNMLIETPSGFDYTTADCRSWLADAGFRETRVERLVGPDSMVVGIK